MTAWDERLITRHEVADQIAAWPLDCVVSLACRECGQAVTTMHRPGFAYVLNPDELAAAVLRHMVSGHGYELERRGT